MKEIYQEISAVKYLILSLLKRILKSMLIDWTYYFLKLLKLIEEKEFARTFTTHCLYDITLVESEFERREHKD